MKLNKLFEGMEILSENKTIGGVKFPSKLGGWKQASGSFRNEIKYTKGKSELQIVAAGSKFDVMLFRGNSDSPADSESQVSKDKVMSIVKRMGGVT